MAEPNPLAELRSSGTVLLVAGVLSVIAGVLAIAYPDITLLALALIAGINLVLLGIMALVDAFADDIDVTGRVLTGVLGLLGVMAGIVVMRRPGESLLALLIIIGIWLVVSGIVDLLRAFSRAGDRALRAMSAAFDLILGILILSWPDLGLATLALFVGIAFVIRGIFCAMLGWRLRREAKAPAVQPTGAAPA